MNLLLKMVLVTQIISVNQYKVSILMNQFKTLNQ